MGLFNGNDLTVNISFWQSILTNWPLTNEVTLPTSGHDRFNCWWRFSVSSLVPLTYFQLKVPYYFLLASGLKYFPPNTSEKFTSSIGHKSLNNWLLNDILSTPLACSYEIWTRERKKIRHLEATLFKFKNRTILTRGRFLIYVYCIRSSAVHEPLSLCSSYTDYRNQ